MRPFYIWQLIWFPNWFQRAALTWIGWVGGCELSYGEEEKIMRFIIFPLQLPCPCYCYNQWEWWTLFMQHNGPSYYQGVCFVPIIMFYHFYLHLLSFWILCCYLLNTLCYITGTGSICHTTQVIWRIHNPYFFNRK